MKTVYLYGLLFLGAVMLVSHLPLFGYTQSTTTEWKSESAWEVKANKTVWLKVSIDNVNQTDYLEIQMFPELVPKAVTNFVELCKGNTYKCKLR